LLDSNDLKSSTYSVLADSPDCYRGGWGKCTCYVLATEGEKGAGGTPLGVLAGQKIEVVL
jgi:hypothetical protein